MDSSATTSLAVALTYVLESFGDSSTDVRSRLSGDKPWLCLPELHVTSEGDYGTYPSREHSVVQFQNGQYYYVENANNHTIRNANGQVIGMQIYGAPVGWIAYEYLKSKAPAMIHMEETVNGIRYKSFGNPRKMYVRKPEGITKIDFSGRIATFRDFVGVPGSNKRYGEMVRVMGTADYPIIPNGQKFYIDIDDWGGFTKYGKVRELHGYFEADLSPDELPPKKSVAASVSLNTVKSAVVPITEVVSAIGKPMTDITPKTPVNTDDFRFRYLRADQKPVRYQAMQRTVAIDYTHESKPRDVIRGDKFGVFGTFRPYGDHNVRLLIKLEGTKLFDQWYGIPEVAANGKPIVEVIPDYGEIATEAAAVKQQIARDAKASNNAFHILSKIELFIKHDLFRIRR